MNAHLAHKGVSQDHLDVHALLSGKFCGLLIGLEQTAQLSLFSTSGLVIRKSVEGDAEGSVLRDSIETDGQGVASDPLDLGRSVRGILVLSEEDGHQRLLLD